jgi:hypothetical protein
MSTEEEKDNENENNEQQDYKPFTDRELVKVMTILFVLAIYLFIFMKILFLN